MPTLLTYVVLALLAINAVLAREVSLQPDGMLHLHMFDVGQGDALFLQTPSGKQIVVDGGPDEKLLSHLTRVMPALDRTIDLVILSHPNADHLTALPALLTKYEVGAVLLVGTVFDLPTYHKLLTIIDEKKIPIILPDPTVDIDLGDGVILDIIWPYNEDFGQRPENENNASVVLRVLYKEHSILLTGDIEADAEMEILKSGAQLTSTILKSPHHGSKSSSTEGLLRATNPSLALISAGKGNRFGHPHQEVIDRYRSRKIEVLSTINNSVRLKF